MTQRLTVRPFKNFKDENGKKNLGTKTKSWINIRYQNKYLEKKLKIKSSRNLDFYRQMFGAIVNKL